MMKILLYGGTGNMGTAIAEKALEKNLEVTTVGKEPIPDSKAKFVHKDNINSLYGTFDSIVDIYNFDKGHAQRLHDMFNKRCRHFIITSTTLVYDRSRLSYERIYTRHPKAKTGTQGGYVDHKLEIEDFWMKREDANWTILRPYHILGKGEYLGCLPPYNRDPYLIEHIKKGKIELCDGGRVPLNVVHPDDIAEIVLRSIGNPATYGKSYNAINPKKVIARDYYIKIAEILGVDLKIENIPAEKIWQAGEWTLTTLPHLYDTSDLSRDIGYVPYTDLETCVKDALNSNPLKMPKNETEIHRRMHILPLPLLHPYFSAV